jgi:alanine dehydrogenase
MLIGVPKEIKTNENRVALAPAGAEALISQGHTVLMEQGAGIGSGFADETYVAAGAQILATADEVWQRAEMIMTVRSRSRWSGRACARARSSTPTSISPPPRR